MTLTDDHWSTIRQVSPVKDSAVSFFSAQYPLIRLFRFGPDVLLYDAKPHFAFCLADAELDVLVDYLARFPEDALAAKYSTRFDASALAALIAKFRDLGEAGVFLPGPAEMISPVDREEIEEMLRYYDLNILLRKFCLEVTQDCNFRCAYCKRTIADGYKGHNRLYMQLGVAEAGIDYYFGKYTQIYDKLSADKKALILRTLPPSLSWYGGEPFLNFDLIRQSAAYFRGLSWERHAIPAESVRFSCNTNLSIMNETIIRFLIDNRVRLFASIDGPAQEHDRSRVFPNQRGTFGVAYRNLMSLKSADPEYFRTHVTILSVYTENHDRAKCREFVQGLGALTYNEYRAEYVGAFVPDAEAALTRREQDASERYAAFQKKALTPRRPHPIRTPSVSMPCSPLRPLISTARRRQTICTCARPAQWVMTISCCRRGEPSSSATRSTTACRSGAARRAWTSISLQTSIAATTPPSTIPMPELLDSEFLRSLCGRPHGRRALRQSVPFGVRLLSCRRRVRPLLLRLCRR